MELRKFCADGTRSEGPRSEGSVLMELRNSFGNLIISSAVQKRRFFFCRPWWWQGATHGLFVQFGNAVEELCMYKEFVFLC